MKKQFTHQLSLCLILPFLLGVLFIKAETITNDPVSRNAISCLQASPDHAQHADISNPNLLALSGLGSAQNTITNEFNHLNSAGHATALSGAVPGKTTSFDFPQHAPPLESEFLMAGQDYYTIPHAGMSFGEDLPTIPEGFFGPGSEPFVGNIIFRGANSQGGQLAQQDLIVSRLEDLPTPEPYPFAGMVPIEITELSLQSVEPIVVLSGTSTSQWFVEVHLFDVNPSPGNANIQREDLNGGIFDMQMFLFPVFTFRNVDNPQLVLFFNPMEFGFDGMPLFPTDPLPWMAPPIPNEFDPIGEQGMTLLTPSGNEFLLVPFLIRHDFAFLSMDQEGQPEAWEGSGFNNSEWYYYPFTDWWNVWFYDHPLDVTRKKLVSGFLEIQPRDPALPSYVEIIINWSTPEWPAWNGYPELPLPPLPDAMTDPDFENQMIERSEPIFVWEENITEPMTVPIPSDYLNNLTGLFNFNPEWISIDLRGYNFSVSADFIHICFKSYDPCGFDIICPDNMEVCSTDDSFVLAGGFPLGGTYSGTGVIGQVFKPSQANWGENVITYTYTDPLSGCTQSCSFIIYVIPPPEMVCPPDMSVCYDDWLISLPDGNPAGGSYSGPGISGNFFKTFEAGTGTHTITYSVTEPCPGSCTFTITVYPNPEVICPDDFTMCANDPILDLQSLVSPSGGTFAGGNLFNPATAPPGVPLQFNYTYTDPATGCDGHCTFYITVYPNPELICPDDFTMCASDSAINLQTLVSPSGGTFAGGNIFNPATAPPGVPLQFNYTYTDPVTGCVGHCTFYITVYPNPEVTCPADMTVCENDGVIDLNALGATPAGGTFTDALGTTITAFDPAGAGPASYLITYCYTDPQTGCKGCCDFAITVYPNPDVTCPGDMAMCIDDNAITLSASPAGGSFSGSGIAGNQFNPGNAGAGAHTIEYCYTDPQTGCEGCCEFTITVHPLPDVVCPPDMEVCIDDFPFALSGATPAGGTYSGFGVAGGMFDPATAGVGLHGVFYDYTDPVTGCYNWCTFFIQVHPLPVVNCPPDFSVCLNDPSFALAGATPVGGVYSNAAGNVITNFKASNYGVGLHAIFYDYTDPVTNCSNWCMFFIEVLPLPVVNCPQDMAVCIDAAPFALTGGTPAGGTYSGIGVAGGLFNPAAAGTGNHSITYTVTDPVTQCTNSCTFKIKVNPLPNVNCPPNLIVCENTPAFALAGATPAGGVYSDAIGPIVNFSPAVWGPGVHTIWYDYTDPVTGCSNWCSFTITVIASPVVTCPGNMVVCENDPSFALAGATPAGGTYTNAAGNVLVNFNPPAAAIGPNVITYSYTDPATGCTGTCTFTITVIAAPIVTCPPNKVVCIDNGPFALVGGAPAGGWFFGAGVVAGFFNPLAAGVGVHTIQYAYTDPFTGCTGYCNFTITVNPLPNVVCPPNMNVCVDALPFALAGGAPVGGTYTGPGVTLGVFNPAIAGAGIHTINYAYTDPATGCSNFCTFTITVNPLPNVVCPPDTTVNIADTAFLLSGGTPAGGIYSDAAGTPLTWFNPSTAGLGNHIVSYTYTDVNGCSNSCNFTITVTDQNVFIDFGDAPDDTIYGYHYNTLLVNNGARHIINPAIYLGDKIDAEPDGQQSLNAKGDDINMLDDEDGVIFGGTMAVGAVAKIKVKASVDGFLNAWIDFDKNGTWAEAGDQIFSDQMLTAGWNTLTFAVPAGINPGKTYARFRFNTTGGLSYDSLAMDGEVEDYRIAIHPPNWHVVFTDLTHLVLVPVNLNTFKAIPGDFTLEAGDFIGAFFSDQGTESCGGAILWEGEENQMLVAFGDDPFTGEKDGFDEGESFGFKVYKGTTGQTLEVEAAFDPTMPNADGKFYNNGLSALTELSLSTLSQTLTIPEGWSGLSSYLNPVDADVASIFAPLSNDMLVLYKLDGSMYWPGQNLNTMGQWNPYDGHIVKMNNDALLEIYGNELVDKTININAGLNLIPVLSSEAVNVEMLFSTIPGLVLVKEVAGVGVYLPGWNINTLENVLPGNAYFVLSEEAGIISFVQDVFKGEPGSANQKPVGFETPWNRVSITPESHVIVFNLTENPIMEGDIIGGFTAKDFCAGTAQAISGSEAFSLTLNADDPFTDDVTGFEGGEKLLFKLYRSATGETFDLEVGYNSAYHPGYYQPNALSEITDLKLLETGTKENLTDKISIYPNPSNGIFNISGAKDCAEVEVVDIYGKQIMKYNPEHLQCIGLTGHPSGLYFLKVKFRSGKEGIYKLILE